MRMTSSKSTLLCLACFRGHRARAVEPQANASWTYRIGWWPAGKCAAAPGDALMHR
jgi:hypothetical protein